MWQIRVPSAHSIVLVPGMTYRYCRLEGAPWLYLFSTCSNSSPTLFATTNTQYLGIESTNTSQATVMSSSVSSVSRRIGAENDENPPLTGMHLRLQQLEERIIASAACANQQLHAPSIIDIDGFDITIEDIQLAKRELIIQEVDLNIDVTKKQKFAKPGDWCVTQWFTPLIHFCFTGNLLLTKILFLISADCTELSEDFYWFPMLAAAQGRHLDICKWLFVFGGDAKYQINKETSCGDTPLRRSYSEWLGGTDNDGKTCCWLLRNGGGQHLSSKAMRRFLSCIGLTGKEKTDSNLLVMWMRESIQLHDRFILFLCGATTMITLASSSSEPSDCGTCKHKRKRKIHPEQSLQILDSHPGIMELIGNYVGLKRGKEFRMLKEFNELIIGFNSDENSMDHIQVD